MQLRNLLESSGEKYMIRWVNGKIVWELPGNSYTYDGYTQKDYGFWRQEISDAGYGHRWEKDRRMVYGRFQKQHNKRRKEQEYYDAIDDMKNGAELVRKKIEADLFSDFD